MSAKAAISIKQLLRASSDDEAALAYPLPDSSFGFHAQQAVEKLYKVVLAVHVGHFPYTHDLLSLRKRVEASAVSLPFCSFRLEDLSECTANARYDEPIALAPETPEQLRTCISDLRAFVLSQIVMKASIEAKEEDA